MEMTNDEMNTPAPQRTSIIQQVFRFDIVFQIDFWSFWNFSNRLNFAGGNKINPDSSLIKPFILKNDIIAENLLLDHDICMVINFETK